MVGEEITSHTDSSRFGKDFEDEHALHYRCVKFYNLEAEVLDDRKFEKWLDLLSDNVQYEVLIRTSRERNAEEFNRSSFHVRDDYDTLETRVKRLRSEFAWSEHPPTRTKRFISNIRLQGIDHRSINVKSNILLHRSQGHTDKSKLVSGERDDVLVDDGGKLKLRKRTVYLTHTKLPFDRWSILTYL